MISTLDFETDPFSHGAIIEPFALGIYFGCEYWQFWGDDCIEQFMVKITGSSCEPQIMYAHNGGKFDFIFLLKKGLLDNPIKIINGRIVSAMLKGTAHELRDSYAILPFRLADYRKDDIDYEKMKRNVRENHKVEILEYLQTDCVALHELVSGFIERFGDKLTVGGAAMSEIRKIYKFDKANEQHDELFRNFYFGGRCEYFERGIIKTKLKVYDVNSQYPAAMVNFDHPFNLDYLYLENPDHFKSGLIKGYKDHKIYFANIECESFGALPERITEGVNKGGLSFPHKRGEFFACSHEIIAGLELGLIKDLKILNCWIPNQITRFDGFVMGLYAERDAAKADDNQPLQLSCKFVLNSGYGKFAQNPDSFKDYLIVDPKNRPKDLNRYILNTDYSEFEIWEKPNHKPQFYDVAIAASITSAARSVLLRGLAKATRPIYCDTDSIICEEFKGDINNKRLGAWKLECTGDKIAIGGKKLYALFDDTECVKMASKGARLSCDEIEWVAYGEEFTWESIAPSINFKGDFKYIKRDIKLK